MNENKGANDNSVQQNYFFGQKLKALRKRKGLSQERLAQKLDTTRATVANYEAGRASPPYWLVKEVAVYFEVDIQYLFEEGEMYENITC